MIYQTGNFRHFWRKGLLQYVFSNHWEQSTDALINISFVELYQALFAKVTGAGLVWENLHPQGILTLPAWTRKALIDLIHLWEQRPEFSKCLATLIVVTPRPLARGVRTITLITENSGQIQSQHRPTLKAGAPYNEMFASTAAADCEGTG